MTCTEIAARQAHGFPTVKEFQWRVLEVSEVSHPMQETKSSVGSRKQVLYDQPSISIESFAGCPCTPSYSRSLFCVICHLSSRFAARVRSFGRSWAPSGSSKRAKEGSGFEKGISELLKPLTQSATNNGKDFLASAPCFQVVSMPDKKIQRSQTFTDENGKPRNPPRFQSVSMAVRKINNDTLLQLIRAGNSPAEAARNPWAQPHKSRPLLCPL